MVPIAVAKKWKNEKKSSKVSSRRTEKEREREKEKERKRKRERERERERENRKTA